MARVGAGEFLHDRTVRFKHFNNVLDVNFK